MSKSRSRTRTTGKHTRAGIAFLAPYVVLLLLFGIGPTVYAVSESFIVTSDGVRRPGLDNYVQLLGDFRLLPAMTNVAIFLAIWLPVMVVGVLFLALLLHQRPGRFSGVMRLVYFLPGAVTGSASVMLWYFMLEPTYSPFGPILRAMGFVSGAQIFANNNLVVIFAVMAFTTGVGQWIVIMYGALQNIPGDLLEAAALDGAGPLRTAILVKLPMVSKYVVYMVILSFATGLQLFVEPQLIYGITKSAGSSWWSLNQFGYALAFQNGNFGGAAAISLVLLVLSALGAFIVITKTDLFSTDAA
ncbi:MAG: carbohydrate ABC transporter permease [Rhodoglobus sp.]